MTYDLVIQNGTIITAEATYQADIGIRGERIAAIGEGLSGARVINAAGKLVTPGAVDVHVHLSLNLGGGLVSSDDWFTGTRAAAFGGTTTIIDFVHPEADESLMQAYEQRRAEADPQTVIDYALHMALGPAQIPQLGQLPAVMKAAGITTYKLYMAYGYCLKDGELLQALEAIRDGGGLPVVHAENWDAITTLVNRRREAGLTEARWFPRCRPALLEGEAAERVITLAEWVGLPVHIFHIGCRQVVERVAAARARGLPVYGETCPQYLLLTEAAYDAPGIQGALPVCAPPLRTEADQQVLWKALANDHLQLVTTDHCPFTREQKARGLDDFSRIPGGVPSIEARFALLYTFGVRAGHFSPERWVDICCTTPARLHHLSRKGQIAVGFDADLVIFDLEKPVRLSTDWLHENVDWTPYDGLDLRGWPVVTIQRGAVLAQDGQFYGRPGQGRYLARSV